MKLTKNLFALTIAFLFSVLLATVLSLGERSIEARAESYVEVETISATCLSGFDSDGNANYVRGADYSEYVSTTGNPYAKDIVVYFTISNARYYKTECVKDGENAPEGVRLSDVPTSGIVSCEVTGSGLYSVACYVYSEERVLLGEKTVQVKSDETAPDLPAANTMTEWIPVGSNFDVIIDWDGCKDDLSGVSKIFYKVMYDNGTQTAVRALD